MAHVILALNVSGNTTPQMNTITTEVSAIQIKSLYLHFKTIRINDSIKRINSQKFKNPSSPQAIANKGEIIYDIIDAISLFEHYHSLCDLLLQSPLLSRNLPPDLSSYLKLARKKMSQWKHVRNKLGGHLDIHVVKELCEEHNYKGVFISNHLEADFKGILLNMMLTNAINATLEKSKLFEKEVDLTNGKELADFISKFMGDWKIALDLFPKINKFLYDIGKEEKLRMIGPEDIGIIKF
jgi:hypothetical protein